MRRPDWTIPHRRTDFRPRRFPFAPLAPAPNPIPEARRICVSDRDGIADLCRNFACNISRDGATLIIQCKNREETDRLLDFLKRKGVHGMIRQRRFSSA